jgi:hypothetical protein
VGKQKQKQGQSSRRATPEAIEGGAGAGAATLLLPPRLPQFVLGTPTNLRPPLRPPCCPGTIYLLLLFSYLISRGLQHLLS